MTAEARLAFTGHLALRQVDGMIRHPGSAEIASWTRVADRRLAEPERL